MKALIIICASIFILLGSIPHVMAKEGGAKKPGFTYSKGKCEINYSPSEIISHEWEGENKLVIKASVNATCCCYYIKKVDYKIEDDTIKIVYKLKKSGKCCKCACSTKLTCELTNLPKKDYNIVLSEKK